ncbi:glycoside hydrolase family 130 protein [Aquimarina sp. ERC-38]|uniref:glycoside hydrolase family 130 protein n=1 Tax=Aquimarina sp. ERC-38 TaxID=2949996 RepID=UPI0022452B73|nr:glycoside hydrolase family 130 protein [Aquimarina sp. ERC-38]UZO81130.1 glycoside hydrolase family 130 protein [Aquimarina sp. ERC-38]
MKVKRHNLKFIPDSSRVVARFFNNGDQRVLKLLQNLNTLSDQKVLNELNHIFMEFAGRHRNISRIFMTHASSLAPIFEHHKVDFQGLSEERKLLLGAYATMEYSIESAALFNPSIIEDFDQSFLQNGEKRVIISLRATGEGHLSSIVFRRGVLDQHNNLKLSKTRNHIDLPKIVQKQSYNKERFVQKLVEMEVPEKFVYDITNRLSDRFEYHDLKKVIKEIVTKEPVSYNKKIALEEITWLVDSYYDINFSMDSDISERVIFPVSPSESQGIEDARFVKFQEDDGSTTIYGLYTAYDGHTILPKLISTNDFQTFRVMPLHGTGAQNKNFAIFPRKINGKYAMLARIDGVNNYLMYSDRITLWNDPIKIQEPQYPWEFTQVGNCGSPIYTEEGWLIITHGVGPMRRYCIGAALFDLNDPTKEIGRLKSPLLAPLENEREGYVPNVVYSCGAIIHNEELVLPYAVSDYSSSYATVNIRAVLNQIKSDGINQDFTVPV